MNRNDVIARGERSVSDAMYIRDRLLPVAWEAERWGIVVFESFRVCELVLKGLICLMGYAPRHTHELACLIDDLIELLTKRPRRQRFLLGAKEPKGNAYAVFLDEKTIELWRIDDRTVTVLAARPSNIAQDALATLRLRLDVGSLITVKYGDGVIFQHPDATYTGPFRAERSFVVVPDDQRIGLMREAAEALRREREAAFYAVLQYSADDAQRAVRAMEHFVATAAMFISVQ
jgi:HEPN domain-containing protein